MEQMEAPDLARAGGMGEEARAEERDEEGKKSSRSFTASCSDMRPPETGTPLSFIFSGTHVGVISASTGPDLTFKVYSYFPSSQ